MGAIGSCCVASNGGHLDNSRKSESMVYRSRITADDDQEESSYYLDCNMLNSVCIKDEENLVNSLFIKVNDLLICNEEQINLIQSSMDESSLKEKRAELFTQSQKLKIRIHLLECKLDTIKDNEILILLVKNGLLKNNSKNKFSVIITQPMKNTVEDDIFKLEDSETNQSNIIDPHLMQSEDKQIHHAKTNSMQKPVRSTTGDQSNHCSASKPNIEKLAEISVGTKISQTPKTKDSKKFDFSSSDAIDPKIYCMNTTAKHTRIDSKSSKSKYFEGSNEYIMVYNSKQVTSTNDKKLSWNEPFVISCSHATEYKTKLFSISLIEHDKGESKIIGGERTFSVDQFDSTKIYDLNIEFKRNFKAETQARISIKLQYINDYIGLINLALNNLRKEQERCAHLLSTIKSRIKTFQKDTKLDPNMTQNGGWYDNGSVLSKKLSQHCPFYITREKYDSDARHSERTKSCQISENDNNRYLQSPDAKSSKCYHITESFANNCESGVLDSSALFGSIIDEIEDRNSILIKEQNDEQIEPGSYMNYTPS